MYISCYFLYFCFELWAGYDLTLVEVKPDGFTLTHWEWSQDSSLETGYHSGYHCSGHCLWKRDPSKAGSSQTPYLGCPSFLKKGMWADVFSTPQGSEELSELVACFSLHGWLKISEMSCMCAYEWLWFAFCLVFCSLINYLSVYGLVLILDACYQ